MYQFAIVFDVYLLRIGTSNLTFAFISFVHYLVRQSDYLLLIRLTFCNYSFIADLLYPFSPDFDNHLLILILAIKQF